MSSRVLAEGSAIVPPLNTLRVLFAGHDMEMGYFFTKEAAATLDPNIEVVRVERDQAQEAARHAHVIVPLMTRIGRDVIEASHDLRFIIQYGAGVEGVDIEAATSRGIFVSNIPSAHTGNAQSCAEHAVFLTLGLMRNWHQMQRSIQERHLGRPMGTMLSGRTVLVVGYGNIAKCLIPLLKAFGVRVLCVRRRWGDDVDGPAALLDDRGTTADYPQLLPQADVVIVTCPQTQENKGFVNREFLSHCKDGVRIVNVARGGLLDYDACREGLESGRIGGLGLDVQWVEPFEPNDPIARHPNVLLTPHIAGVTDVSYRNMARIVAEEAHRIRMGYAPTFRGASQLLNKEAVLPVAKARWNEA